MRGLITLAAVVAALAAAPLAHAAEQPAWKRHVATALEGVDGAEASARLSPEDAARYRAALAQAARAIETLYPGRAAIVEKLVADVAAAAKLYNGPRALTLFSMLETNVEYLSTRAIPPGGRDVVGADGIVYRAFNGSGLQFHPLANAAKLNAHLAANRDDEAFALAEALLARAQWNGAGELYEYWFRFHNVAPPWSSGMAQAVLAQALARAGERFADARFTEAARRAYAAIPAGLVIGLPEGPWIRLYSRLDLVVLNAQLQAALSVADYAALAGDVEADAFAAELRTAAAALLPRFDTGAWTRYSLGEESSLSYQQYVVSLLKRLAVATGEPLWRETAERFERYELEAPLVNVGPAPAPVYPVPLDGHRDTASLRVWVSKLGTATLSAAGGGTRFSVRRGWNTLEWRPPAGARPGTYEVALTVTDPAGNETVADAPPIEIRRDVERPQVTFARLRGRMLSWRVSDETPRVRLVVAPYGKQRLDLGWHRLTGYRRLPRAIPARAILRIVDTAGNAANVRLAG